MTGKFNKIFFGEVAQDLVGKLFIVLAIVYLLLFCGESVMPGLVMDVLNINILLLLILAGVGYFAYLEKRGLRIEQKLKLGKLAAHFMIALILLVVAAALFIVQYKISIPETIFYMAFAFLLGGYFYKMIN